MLSAKCCLRIAALVAVLAVPALAREWHVSSFVDNISVEQDGTMTVRERLMVDFEGAYHGIYRDIPVEYPGPHGSNYTLFLTVTSVTDGQGESLKYDSSVQTAIVISRSTFPTP